jgi:hypothetical protein
MRTGAGPSRESGSGDQGTSLLLDRNLDLRPSIAQASITVLSLLEPLTPREEQPTENQQASQQSFHAFSPP